MRTHTIQVDEEVYKALEQRITGFGDTPNQILRSLLSLSTAKSQPPRPPQRKLKNSHRKAPKTNIKDLISAGSLREGQKLYLYDYQGNKLLGVEATLRGNQLEHSGQFYSMSALTKKFMQQQGYQSDSYRGPKFWHTEDGRSVSELWDEYIKSGITV